ncbi:penicillin acylase family protein [Pseudoalteromonas sp. McH1-7]|uniref:penicillin acylase family protein n=1 Tax=Pseudoalteromonas sp. McH1-7 TaxID=2745574 RepID=UPI00158FCDDF|nr:penicillin acylase family protein [Pseudoalteromonas sp. McH1-7]NUZ11437.1 penicillin acylase family protein [Pseudoalteromonas sp. McH1-7]
MNSNTLLIPLLLFGSVACQADYSSIQSNNKQDDSKLKAKITRTEFGIAHVTAHDLRSLAFGSGYAQAQDHACVLADSYLRVRGERAKYLGADLHHAGDNRHVMSDYLFKIADIHQQAKLAFPHLSEDTQAAAEGFAAGFNLYLAEVEEGKASLEPTCQGQNWVQPITAIDVLANIAAAGSGASLGQFATAILQAHPGQANEWLPSAAKPVSLTAPLAAVPSADTLVTQGSNAWAIGGALSDDGKGLLMANPHFPMTGQMRFWAYHANIPGQLDVMGASLLGFPAAVNIGFNHNIAWSHTYSASTQSVIYRLTLDATDPLKYVVDGETKQIAVKDIAIEVLSDSGEIYRLHKPVYKAEGGMLVEIPKVLEWSEQHAYVLKNTNINSFAAIDHWLALNKAQTLAEFQQTFKDHNGLMFNNVIYTDKDGQAFYIDAANVPDLPPIALQYLNDNAQAKQYFAKFRVPVLPGDSAAYYYQQSVPYEAKPKLTRTDYVQNANDSYWLANASAPIAKVSPLYGQHSVLQSRRTRHSLAKVSHPVGADNKFSADEVATILLSNTALITPIIDDVIAACKQGWQRKTITIDEQSIALAPSCAALQKWDGHFNQTSIAAHLVREFVARVNDREDFEVSFDARDPVNTPRNIRIDEALFKELAIAGEIIRHAGFTLEASLGELQFFEQHGQRFAWQGNMNVEGGLNVFATQNRLDQTIFAPVATPSVTTPYNNRPLWSGLSQRGYELHFGSSWMMVVDFEQTGVKAQGLLTYSQSQHPDAENSNDQTRHYSEQNKLVTLPFEAADIATTQISTTVIKQ